MCRLLDHPGHPRRILRGIEAVESGRIGVELVTEYEHDMAEGVKRAAAYRAGRLALGAGTFPLRQALEQYFTSSQFLAQALRQLMGRPQRAQGLVGSAALLPLKPRFGALI